MNYDKRTTEDARLYILKLLEAEVGGHLNEITLRHKLQISWGIDRTREWLRTQLNRMAELEAVELIGGGEVAIARITPDGRNHLEERSVIEGITRPRLVS